MPRTPGKKGLLPNDPSRPRVSLENVIRGTAPAQVHWGWLPVIGMLGNDQYGDCVDAGSAHMVEGDTFWGQGTEVEVSTEQTLAMYTAIAGFDPNAGPPGSNPTDQGSTLQAGLGYLVNTGLAGVKFAAYGELSPRSTNKWKQALAEIGPLMIGVGVGDTEEQQFAAGQPWSGSQVNQEDHCVILCGYQPNLYFCWTWGGIQGMTSQWFENNCAEVWAAPSLAWVSKVKGTDPAGVDLAEFGAQYTALTGKPDPFTA